MSSASTKAILSERASTTPTFRGWLAPVGPLVRTIRKFPRCLQYSSMMQSVPSVDSWSTTITSHGLSQDCAASASSCVRIDLAAFRQGSTTLKLIICPAMILRRVRKYYNNTSKSGSQYESGRPARARRDPGENSDPLLSPVVYRKIRPPLTAIRGIRAIYREAEGLPTSVLEAMAIGV